eukprot:8760737-Pyramimonas_sp.AAC.1
MKPAAARVEGHRKNVDRWKDKIKELKKEQVMLNYKKEDAEQQLERACAALKEAIRDRDGEEEEADNEEENNSEAEYLE